MQDIRDEDRHATPLRLMLVDLLRTQLRPAQEGAQQEREAAQERERAYREHLAHLTVMLDQAHQQNQRLLEAPRNVPSPMRAAPPVPSAETTGVPARDVSPGMASFPHRSAARHRILALL